jgi:hypothetical protein
MSEENVSIVVAELADGERVVVANDTAAAQSINRPSRHARDRVRARLAVAPHQKRRCRLGAARSTVRRRPKEPALGGPSSGRPTLLLRRATLHSVVVAVLLDV